MFPLCVPTVMFHHVYIGCGHARTESRTMDKDMLLIRELGAPSFRMWMNFSFSIHLCRTYGYEHMSLWWLSRSMPACFWPCLQRHAYWAIGQHTHARTENCPFIKPILFRQNLGCRGETSLLSMEIIYRRM